MASVGIGDQLGGYRIERELGQGGMGVVYLVRDGAGTPFAMKVMQRSEGMTPDEADRRLAREANVSRVIRHPGVVQMVGFGTIDADHRYLVMELLEGLDLDELITKRPPTLTEYLELLVPAMDALDAAHTLVNLDGTPQPVVHRDVKPSNIYVLDQPKDGSRVKVVDFGLVKQQGAMAVTQASAGFGTMFYMAPEQFMGAGRATPAADVWALGVMVYEAVTSCRPFIADDPRGVISRVLQGHPPRLDAVVPGCPKLLADVVDACLEPGVEERPQTAGALASPLRALLTDATFRTWADGIRVRDPGERSVQSLLDSGAYGGLASAQTVAVTGELGVHVPAMPAPETMLASPGLPQRAPATAVAGSQDPVRSQVAMAATMLATEPFTLQAPAAPFQPTPPSAPPAPAPATQGATGKLVLVVVVCAVAGYFVVQFVLRAFLAP